MALYSNLINKKINLIKKVSYYMRNHYSSTSNYFNFVFLCGGKKDSYTSRIDTENLIFKDRVDILSVYSEDIFGSIDIKFDLLNIEKILAEIAQLILIYVESYGTACELGAFTYLDSMSKKVIAVMDYKYRHDSSFINGGPIKKISSIGKNRVFYETFQKQKTKSGVVISDKLFKGINESIITTRNFKKWYEKDPFEDKIYVTKLETFFVFLMDYIIFMNGINPKYLYTDLKVLLQKDNILFKFSEETQTSFNTEDILDICVNIAIKWNLLIKYRNWVEFNPSMLVKLNRINYYQCEFLFQKTFLNDPKFFKYRFEALNLSRGLKDFYEKYS